MSQSYQYRECGLDSVWIENGYSIERDDWGDLISLVDVDGLNNAIGARLVAQQRPLNGAELRFLRVELLADVERLGAKLGIDPSLISLWEAGRDRPLPDEMAERRLRTHYAEILSGLDVPVDSGPAGNERLCFRREGAQWVAV